MPWFSMIDVMLHEIIVFVIITIIVVHVIPRGLSCSKSTFLGCFLFATFCWLKMKIILSRKLFYILVFIFWYIFPQDQSNSQVLIIYSSNNSKFLKTEKKTRMPWDLENYCWRFKYTQIYCNLIPVNINPLSAKPTIWSNTLKQFILLGWRLKD